MRKALNLEQTELRAFSIYRWIPLNVKLNAVKY